jgi:NADH dehydrogenase [ubiquinone] 1 alpha subcomplex assembly factor 7
VNPNALAERIAGRIRRQGPLSVAAYMAMALHDPDFGYYARRRPIGAAGDYVTAPEISQVFGELIGLWCAATWQQMGRPDPVILAELGPGSGVLLADLLRAAAALPEFSRALRPYLVEASPILRAEQQCRLAAVDCVWLDRVEDLPEGLTLLVANEFLDALPIRQLVRGRRHWSERMVALDCDDRLVFIDGAENPAASLLVSAALREAAEPGAVFEICPAAAALAASLGACLKRRPSAALLIDYGYFPSRWGPTVRAVSGHRAVGVLESPGCCDLSAHVDFAAFSRAAQAAGAEVYGPVPQGQFLTDLGALERLAALSTRATAAQLEGLRSGVERLLDPEQMGSLFKVMALLSPGLAAPLGFGCLGTGR